jgi:hypothetical protein
MGSSRCSTSPAQSLVPEFVSQTTPKSPRKYMLLYVREFFGPPISVFRSGCSYGYKTWTGRVRSEFIVLHLSIVYM